MKKVYITTLLVGVFCSSCSTTKNKTTFISSPKIKKQIKNVSEKKKFRILAEGDSWFAYPKSVGIYNPLNLGDWLTTFISTFIDLIQVDSNIIECLESSKYGNKLKIHDISNSGGEAVDMLVGKSKHKYIKKLKKAIARKEPYDAILFSGGGNDLGGENDFPYILKEYKPDKKVEDLINKKRFDRRMEMTKLIYHELIDITTEIYTQEGLKPPPIITHTYDFVYPRSEGPNLSFLFLNPAEPMNKTPIDFLRNLRRPFFKGWLHKYMIEKKFPKDGEPNSEIKKKLTDYLVRQLKKMLQEIEKEYSKTNKSKLIVVDTQGIIDKKIIKYEKWAKDNDENLKKIDVIRAYWRDEFHPNRWGFKPIIEKIYKEGIEPLVLEKERERIK